MNMYEVGAVATIRVCSIQVLRQNDGATEELAEMDAFFQGAV